MPELTSFAWTKQSLLSVALIGAGITFAQADELSGTNIASPAAPPFKSIWKFKSQPHEMFPQGGVALDRDGNIYGTRVALLPCSSACGDLYRISKPAGGKWTFESIHTFPAHEGAPFPSLVSDGNTIYGITDHNGAAENVGGLLFRLTGSPGHWTYKVLHHFDPTNLGGSSPLAGVTVADDGTLYGVAQGGHGTEPPCSGVVFKITKPNTYSFLHDFSNETGDVSGGCNPQGELVFGKDGALYGTTASGGTSGLPNGTGTVFRLALNGKFSVIHNFVNSTDGEDPRQRIAVGPNGTLYGTTQSGGPHNHGTAWSLKPKGSQTGTFTVIYDFPQGGGAVNGIVRDKAGNLYGTINGSNNESADFREGALYRLSPPASGSTWTFTLLHDFGLLDGALPTTGPTLDGQTLYGQTYSGGNLNGACESNEGCGTVYSYRLQ